MTTTRICIAAAAAAAWLAACTQEPESTTSAPAADDAAETQPAPAAESPPAAAPEEASATQGGMPERIVAERGGFIPEGVEYDAGNHRFLTGSLAEGSIFRIDTDGTVVPVVTDPDLVSSVGIEVDEARDRLLVCNSDRAVFDGSSMGQAKLGIYGLTTGERLGMVDLTSSMRNVPEDAQFFANDVTVDDDGNVYVTDTRQNVVYKVDPDQQASVFYHFEPMEGLALNGIEYDPDGYLIVIGGPKLYKITTTDPAQMTEVELPEPIQGADGMVFLPDGRLAVVSNSENRVVALASDDDWNSATVESTASYEGQATTAAVAGDDVYIVHPHFNDEEPPVIERVSFD
jgi:sugar lactone lactonase YvrE